MGGLFNDGTLDDALVPPVLIELARQLSYASMTLISTTLTHGFDREFVRHDVFANGRHTNKGMSVAREVPADDHNTHTVRLLSSMIFFIILTAARYRNTYLSCQRDPQRPTCHQNPDLPDRDVTLVLL